VRTVIPAPTGIRSSGSIPTIENTDEWSYDVAGSTRTVAGRGPELVITRATCVSPAAPGSDVRPSQLTAVTFSVDVRS